MRYRLVTCDNCFAEIARLGKGEKEMPLMLLGYRAIDLCPTCGSGMPRDLAGVPLDEWPLYVRREDVRVYLEQMGEINGSPSET